MNEIMLVGKVVEIKKDVEKVLLAIEALKAEENGKKRLINVLLQGKIAKATEEIEGDCVVGVKGHLIEGFAGVVADKLSFVSRGEKGV